MYHRTRRGWGILPDLFTRASLRAYKDCEMTKEDIQVQVAKASGERDQAIARANVMIGYVQGLEYALREKEDGSEEPKD